MPLPLPLRTVLFAAVLALPLLPGPARALDLGAMTDAERAAFGAAVRDYLLENPEVLLEAIGELERRQGDAQASADLAALELNHDALFNDPQSWVGGNLEGDVTVVEFLDYRCGYCRRAHPEIEALVAGDGNIRLILKEFPILGEDSTASARFAIATLQVAGRDAYKAVHDALIALRGPADETALRKVAVAAGLDPEPILARMSDPAVSQVISDNHALARRLQINGTPTFVIEDRMVRGFVPLEGMQQIVAEVRDRQ